MKGQIKKILLKYPIIWGIAGIGLLLCAITLFTLKQRSEEGVLTVIPEELEREHTTEYIMDPKDMADYFMRVVEKDDFDAGLRAFSIGERCYGMQSLRGLRENDMNLRTSPILSGDYSQYSSIASAEFTREYIIMYQNWKDAYADLENPQIVSTNYIYPMESKENLEDVQTTDALCERWGSTQLCEIEVILESKGQNYSTVLTLMEYGGFWKIFSIGKSVLSEEEEQWIYPLDHAVPVYSSSEQTQVEKNLLEDYEKKDIKENRKEIKEALKAGEELLPGNYYVAVAQGKERPEQTIRAFIRYIQRQDFVAAIGFGAKEDEYAHVSSEVLVKQGEFASQVKTFLYDFMLGGKKYANQLNKKDADDILKNIKPEYCFDIEIAEIEEVNEGEYLVTYSYTNKEYQVKFDMVENNVGWQIQSIGSVKRVKK